MTTDKLAKQLEEKEQECKELEQVKKDLPDIQMPYVILYRQIKEQYYKLEQECEYWKKELDKTHLLMLEKQDELVKEILKNDQLKTDNEILEKDKANLDAIIETLKAQFKQLEKENVKLKELVKTRIEDLCDSCGASSMMPMPCKVYEQTLQEIKGIVFELMKADKSYKFDKYSSKILQKCEVLKDE